MRSQDPSNADLWAGHHAEMRDPHDVVSQWQPESRIDPEILRFRVRGRWWEALAATRQTLFVTREFEHLVVALRVKGTQRRVSYLRLPHPSGLTIDPDGNRLFIASTRNPNVVFEFKPAARFLGGGDRTGRTGRAGRTGGSGAVPQPRDRPALGRASLRTALLPVRARFLPGGLYLHDLAIIGRRLYGNAVGLNAIVELPAAGGFRPVWWPRSIDARSGPRFDRNYLQLNSIAAGRTLGTSFFTASAATPGRRRPGHLSFPVDGCGVVFSGRTREVAAGGLTRPHSARFFGRELWVANSGYGELGRITAGRYEPVARLEGWTRGLTHHAGIAFVGSSRVIPRYRVYAPGLDIDRSETGVHAVDLATGKVVGSLLWPRGNQIFAVELSGAMRTVGFPLSARNGRQEARVSEFFFRGSAA